jgi:hypothetical protein
MGTKRVQLKEVLPWLVHWASRAGTRDFYPALPALYKIFFPHRTLFQFMCPAAQQPGQAVVQGRLSLNVCLRSCLSCFPSLVLASSHGLCVCEETFF